jgi:WD40 repeat protein
LEAFVLLSALLPGTPGGQAQNATPELPTEPILRIETGLHSADISRIDTDAENHFAVTASVDKTVRVWSLPDGRLIRVLRLPIDQRNIGKAYAVAISPDGAVIAVGGWTGPAGHNNIFLLDRESGEPKQDCLRDLPGVINDLAYSPDGRRLAASLGMGNGIRVFEASSGYRPLPSDAQYGDNTISIAFDRSGRLVTTSDDGFVRLYAADHYDIPTARYGMPGHKPYSVAFSPDGTRLAVSHDNTNDIVVLSAVDLKELYKANTAGVNTVGFSAVGWSEDSRYLFAGGRWSVRNQMQVRRWSNGGRGAFVDISSGSDTIQQILELKKGGILIASTNDFGVIQTEAKPARFHAFGALQLSSGRGPFRISGDGEVVQVDSWEPLHTYRFALKQRQIVVDPPPDASLLAPVTNAPRISVKRWRNSTAPTLHGSPLELNPDEMSRSLAVVPGTERFVLGTEWWLRLFDQDGHNVWPARPVPGVAWHVNVTADGRLIGTAFGDGTIRWSRVSDGEEVLALFVHPDGERWIAWTPQGYYDASTGADDLIGWHINHGYDRAPDFYPVSQFRKRFYRPDVIQRVLPSLEVAEAVRQADQAAGQSLATAAPVSSLLPPVVQILDPKDSVRQDRTDVQLAYSVRLPSALDTLRVEALVDGVKVAAEDNRLVDKGDTRAGILHIKIPRRDSKVSVIAYNDNGASVPASVRVHWTGAGTEPKLTLYVLAIGIGNYKDPVRRLRFAAKDADDFVSVVKAQAGGLYEKVVLPPGHESLRDEEATREAILDGLDWIMRAVTNTDDVAMVFLSGGGVTTPDQHYRFLPYDYDPDHIERTTISDSELQDYLTKIGGKKIFFFDTCYSGSVLSPGSRKTSKSPEKVSTADTDIVADGEQGSGKLELPKTYTGPNVDKFANELKAAENGIVVFASSTGNELSMEREDWKNGAFTKAVVEGMGGAAARPGVAAISMFDLGGYISRRVMQLTKGNQRPVMAMPKTVEDYWIAARLN